MRKVAKGSINGEKNTGNLQERTYYQCYCSRNYLSYSALYLHVKNKHNQNLSFKNFCKRRTHWSGSIKNIILQFDEDAEERKTEPLSLKLRERPKKQKPIKQISDSEEGREVNVKAEQLENDITPDGKNIVNVFQLYSNVGDTQEIKLFRRQLLNQFVQFLDRNYANFSTRQPQKHYRSYCMENSCQEIPMLSQYFFQQECYTSPMAPAILMELMNLSDWLYRNLFSTLPVVKMEEKQTFPVKVEEFGSVKAQKAEHDQL